MTRLDFRILGPLEVRTPTGEPLDLGARKQRAVLALLLVDPGRVVSLDRIVHGLWAGEAPSSATGTLQAYVSQLRRVLEPDRPPRTPPAVLVTRDPGYALAVAPSQVDAVRFAAAVEAARADLRAGAYDLAERSLTAALGEWRGAPFADFADEEFAVAPAAQLTELRDSAVEELIEVQLATGRPAGAAASAQGLLERHPFRERAWGQLMIALYRAGRQADALAAYRRAREVLDDELGLPPGPHLQALEAAILRQDPDLDPVGGSYVPALALHDPAHRDRTTHGVPDISEKSGTSGDGGRGDEAAGGAAQRVAAGAGPLAGGQAERTAARGEAFAGGPSATHRESLAGRPSATHRAAPAGGPSANHRAALTGGPSAARGATFVGEAAGVEPLVGRAAEEQHVADRIAQAGAGRGGVLLVVGEAGVGKSLLAEWAAATAERHGLATAWSRCVEAGATPAFWPWAQVLRALPDTPERRHLRDVLAGRGDSEWRREDPDAGLFHLHEAVAETLREAAGERPLLVVVDDLHVADASSLQLLAHLAPALHRLPILLLATLRPEAGDADPALREALALLANERGAERLRLGSFTAADIADYLGGRPGADVVEALLERTGGNPFYLKELLRLLASEHPGGWGSAQAVVDTGVPESVRDVISRRVSRLPDDTQVLLHAAAVIGRDVSLLVLEASTDRPNEAVLEALEPAVAAGLLTEVPGTWDYRFSHAIVRDTVYGGLSRLQRARLHKQVGEALERAEDPALLPLLVHHFTMAAPLGVADRAVRHARRAAELAMAQLAYDEAARYLETALGATRPGASRDRGRLLVQLGVARRAAGDVAGTRAVLDEALTVATQLGDDELAMDAATLFGGVTLWTWRPYLGVDERMIGILRAQLGRLDPADDRRRAVLLGTLAVELYYSPDRPEGEEHAARAVALARGSGDPDLLVRTLNNYWVAAWVPQREAPRRAVVDELLAIDSLTPTVEVTALVHRMMSRTIAGDLAGFDADLARCVRLAEEIRTPVLGAQVRYARAGRAINAGDWATAERLVGEAFALQEHTSLWGTQWIRLAMLHTSRRFEGRPGDLRDELVRWADEPLLELLRPTAVLAACESGDEDLARELVGRWGTARDHLWCWSFIAFQWGLVAARLGTPDPRELYDEILPFADQWSSVGSGCATWGTLHFVLAELAARLGDPAALEHATAALAEHTRVGIAHLVAASRAQVARMTA
ncbi:BTAD domain-containing putative transcriptional regulator [Dactylosporangium sucinum]|uniref:BTAD domain-containing putative transcriptional regulator n=1 Tax=Dactylosporangium sucinum TaxID=1424081 RepID=UPI00167E35B1|nr:BTAD domain-containing putative transcriptional regulator [Dactylosporangium sucinum]